MRDFYQFAGSHPLLTFALACCVVQVISYPFRLVNRFVRARNIKNAGWPPEHLDADGDTVKKEA
jgi:hypothetical protein